MTNNKPDLNIIYEVLIKNGFLSEDDRYKMTYIFLSDKKKCTLNLAPLHYGANIYSGHSTISFNYTDSFNLIEKSLQIIKLLNEI